MNENMMANDSIWIFALLILLFGANGSLLGGKATGGDYATQEDVTNTANFSRLESQVRDNANLTERKTDSIINGISSLGFEMAKGFCNTSKEILESRYLTAQEINNAKAEVLAKINQNEVDALRAKVSQLEMAQALCGVPKYTANYVMPYIPQQCGCNGQNNI